MKHGRSDCFAAHHHRCDQLGGLIGIFQFDLVSYLFGGQGALVSRIIYTLVGAAGLWCISLMFRDREPVKD